MGIHIFWFQPVDRELHLQLSVQGIALISKHFEPEWKHLLIIDEVLAFIYFLVVLVDCHPLKDLPDFYDDVSSVNEELAILGGDTFLVMKFVHPVFLYF
jgi:hypothetical protein